jgi:hypothetical protein
MAARPAGEVPGAVFWVRFDALCVRSAVLEADRVGSQHDDAPPGEGGTECLEPVSRHCPQARSFRASARCCAGGGRPRRGRARRLVTGSAAVPGSCLPGGSGSGSTGGYPCSCSTATVSKAGGGPASKPRNSLSSSRNRASRPLASALAFTNRIMPRWGPGGATMAAPPARVLLAPRKHAFQRRSRRRSLWTKRRRQPAADRLPRRTRNRRGAALRGVLLLLVQLNSGVRRTGVAPFWRTLERFRS